MHIAAEPFRPAVKSVRRMPINTYVTGSFHALPSTDGNHMRRNKTKCVGLAAGFTLAEALLAVVLLGIAASSVLLPFSAGAIIHKEGTARTLASNLASEQLEKVLQTPFTQVVSKWNNFAEQPCQITDAEGDILTGAAYSAFTRKTTCSYVYVGQQSGSLPPSLISVTVEVSYRGAPLVTVNRLISE